MNNWQMNSFVSSIHSSLGSLNSLLLLEGIQDPINRAVPIIFTSSSYISYRHHRGETEHKKSFCECSGWIYRLPLLKLMDDEDYVVGRSVESLSIWSASGFVWFVSLNLLLDFPIDNGNQLGLRSRDSIQNLHRIIFIWFQAIAWIFQ